MRMLRLASELRRLGGEPLLVCNPDPTVDRLVVERGLPCRQVPLDKVETGWEAPLLDTLRPVRVWVNDRLATSRLHTQTLKLLGLWVATVDDSGEGAEDSDLHLIPLFSGGSRRAGQRVLEGWEWAFLPGDEILTARAKPRPVQSGKPSIGVCLGGSDNHGSILPVLDRLFSKNLGADVCLGPAFQEDYHIEARLKDPRIRVVRGVPSLVHWLQGYDMAITGGGMSALEAAAVGTPPCIVANEAHEVETARRMEAEGLGIYWGQQANLPELPAAAFLGLSHRASLGRALRVDGASRVAGILMEESR
jgi:hypothetical protein